MCNATAAPDTTPVNLTVTPLLRLKVRLPGSVTAAVKLTDLVNNAVSPACGTAPFCQFEAVPQTCVPVPPIHVHVAAIAVPARQNAVARTLPTAKLLFIFSSFLFRRTPR